MNPSSDATPELSFEPRSPAPAAAPPPRPLYWSLRRELWENRSIYVVPLVVAAVMLLGFLVSAVSLPGRLQASLTRAPAEQLAVVVGPYAFAAFLMIATGFIVGAFYCLDALHGERRDRSILFWKSLPVSDLTIVLAKASIPLVALPLLTYTLIQATHLSMLLVSTLALLAGGPSVAALWERLPLLEMPLLVLYALVAISLWHAPVYGWFLLVSGWARRATFLWAVLPFVAIAVFERVALRTSHAATLLRHRLLGGLEQAFVPEACARLPADPLAALAPGRLLTAPGLWLGLLAAALFVAAAARLRRGREPL